MIIKLLIEGGDMKPGPAIAQQLGPMGINMGKVISDVNNSTKGFKGMKVPVELDVDKKTKSFTVKVFSPPTAELLKKEMNLEKGSAKISEQKVGNASIEDMIKIALVKHQNMLEKDLKAAVKSVLGTAKAMGLFVESKDPAEVIFDIEHGKFDKEIKNESSETTSEKRKQLDKFFNDIKKAQEMKAEIAKKAAEEAEKAKAETAATPAAAAAVKTEGAKPGAGSAAAGKAAPAGKAAAKPAEKKK